MTLNIKQTTEADLSDIFKVQAEAFGYEKEAKLVESLLGDPSANPKISLIAYQEKKPVGHILFTAGKIINSNKKVSLLAPLAVIPEYQSKGIGGMLIKAGLKHLTELDFDFVFVLGHPTYYPKYGFIPAHSYGLKAPYPIPEIHWDAWMVQALNGTDLTSTQGTVVCADELNRPEHWRE
ncbi:GNAT family N-acetyltransferase [Desulfovibrio sp. UCD-KL4C]|uniref:GNAT family N-acetyltransferase n=1 Tax=Desulfovibrio sp. UCD-KL4C TaxID=2578120 RepID=UPI0025B9AB4E|nr:N-acetyltransferase [Desulfovibrio sp. UCD-KL4C]